MNELDPTIVSEPDSIMVSSLNLDALMVPMIVSLVLALLMLVAMFRIYSKAGQPAWAVIVPIYNLYIWLKIVGRPTWWLLLMLVPFVNLVVAILLYIDLAKSFGNSGAFGFFGLILFPYIGFPILAFGSAKYVGPVAAQAGVAPAGAPMQPVVAPVQPAAAPMPTSPVDPGTPPPSV